MTSWNEDDADRQWKDCTCNSNNYYSYVVMTCKGYYSTISFFSIYKPPGCVAPNDISICSIVGRTWGELKWFPLKETLLFSVMGIIIIHINTDSIITLW